MSSSKRSVGFRVYLISIENIVIISLWVSLTELQGCVDILGTANMMRRQRMQMIQSYEQYAFIYRAVRDYINVRVVSNYVLIDVVTVGPLI